MCEQIDTLSSTTIPLVSSGGVSLTRSSVCLVSLLRYRQTHTFAKSTTCFVHINQQKYDKKPQTGAGLASLAPLLSSIQALVDVGYLA